MVYYNTRICFCRYGSQKRPLSSEESALQRHLLQTTPLHPDIFFLYWEESPDFAEINRLVVRWLVGLGHRVLDLADEVLQEEIMAAPECWVLDKLENPNVKVIVVESETVAKCLQATPDATVCTRTAGIDGLRLISLRHIQARLAANYQRLSVIQYACSSRASRRPQLNRHCVSGGDFAADSVSDDSGVVAQIHDTNNPAVVTTTATISASDDSQQQQHVEVAVISGSRSTLSSFFGGGGGNGYSSLVPTLVPHTRYSLPEHLAELQAWLVDTQSSWDDNGNQQACMIHTFHVFCKQTKRFNFKVFFSLDLSG